MHLQAKALWDDEDMHAKHMRTNCWQRNAVAPRSLGQPAAEKCAKATTQHLDSHNAYINIPTHTVSLRAESIDKRVCALVGVCVCAYVHKPNVCSNDAAYSNVDI